MYSIYLDGIRLQEPVYPILKRRRRSELPNTLTELTAWLVASPPLILSLDVGGGYQTRPHRHHLLSNQPLSPLTFLHDHVNQIPITPSASMPPIRYENRLTLPCHILS